MSTNMRSIIKIVLLLAVAAAVAAWFLLVPQGSLSFETLVENQARLQAAVDQQPLLAIVVFVVIYLVSVALALPLTTLFSLAGGLLFGLQLGLLLVVTSAAAGAVVAFLFARFLLGDWVKQRFQGKLMQAINDGVSKNGLHFLLFVRLVPIFPFFLINLAAAFTPMRLSVFFLGTAVGIIPGSFVYVNAGRALGEIQQPSDILSGTVLGAFALLGLFALIPVFYKKLRSSS